MFRHMAPIMLALCLVSPPRLFAQTVDHDDVEVIHAPAFKAANEKKPDLVAVTKFVVDKTNDFRAKEGRSRVTPNTKLTEEAGGFAAYMAQTGRFGHTADGSRPAERAAKQGYEYCIVAENIAYEFNSAGFTTDELGEKFVRGWENSPGHRKNMLDPDVTETGVAIARSEKTGYYFAVQVFGRPKSLALQFKVVNDSDATVKYRVGDKAFSLPPRYTRTHEQCRPTKVTFELSIGEKATKEEQALEAVNGSRFVLTQDGDNLRVKKE